MSDIRRVEEKIDLVVSDIGEIKVVLGKQHEVLKEHIKRSNMLEEQMKPIQRHVSHVEGALKLIGVLAMIAGIIEVILLAIK